MVECRRLTNDAGIYIYIYVYIYMYTYIDMYVRPLILNLLCYFLLQAHI